MGSVLPQPRPLLLLREQPNTQALINPPRFNGTPEDLGPMIMPGDPEYENARYEAGYIIIKDGDPALSNIPSTTD